MKRWITFAFALSSAAAAAQEPVGSTMSLRAAVTYALEHSPDLRRSQVEVSRREGLATTTRSFLMPQLDASADASTTRSPLTTPSL